MDSDDLFRQPEGKQGIALAEIMHIIHEPMYKKSIKVIKEDNIKEDNDQYVENPILLEFGYASGNHIIELFDELHLSSYYGVEISSTMDEKVRNIKELRGYNTTFILTEPNVLPSSLHIRNATVNYVLMHNIIYFIKDLAAYLKDLKKLLAPGAMLLIGVKENKIFKESDVDTSNMFLRSSDQIMTECKIAGFRLAKTLVCEANVPQFHDKPVRFYLIVAS